MRADSTASARLWTPSLVYRLRRGRVASLQVQDPGDQGGVRGALPGVTLDRHAMNVMLMVPA